MCRRRKLRRRVSRLVVLAGLAALWSAPGAAVPAGAEVVAADTVWRGTVEISGEVVVEAEATLLVLPGTTVRFARPPAEGDPPVRLLVRGVLLAQGTPAEPIVFTSAAEAPRPGDWGGVVFDQSSRRLNRLRHCRIEYATHGIGASMAAVAVEDSELRRNQIGLHGAQRLVGRLYASLVHENDVGLYFNQSQGFVVENSRIQGNARAGAVCVNGSEPRIRQCRIEGNGDVGVSCIQGASPVIEGNEIRGHERGIHVELKSSPQIRGNAIRENGTGVWAEKLVFPTVEGNAINGNRTGIYCNYSAYPRIHGNDLSGNASFAVVLGDQQSIQVEKQIPYRDRGQFFREAPQSPEALPPQARKFAPFEGSEEGVVDARGNWWGEAATAQMKERGGEGNADAIDDARDKPDTEYLGQRFPRDRVVFAPWEERPLAAAGRSEAKYAGVRGKVLFRGAPAAGARVHVYRDAAADFRGEGFSYSGPVGPDGEFSLPLAPGRYYLVAKRAGSAFPEAEPSTGELFGYYGGNPVLVGAGEYREANLFAVEKGPSEVLPADLRDAALLEGTVVGPDGPLEGAFLHVYPDASRDFRGPDLFGPQGAVLGGTGADGRFSLELPPGRYYLVASKRQGGRGLGPLQAGDHFGYFDGNPVRISAGEKLRVTVQAAEKAREVPAQPASVAGLPGIRGTIRGPAGEALKGVYAYASPEPNFMTGVMPPFRSVPVGPDGAYFIDLPGPGTYYVGARSGYGGPPLPGEWFGVHGAALPEPVAVEAGGPREGVDIVVRRME